MAVAALVLFEGAYASAATLGSMTTRRSTPRRQTS